MKKFTLTFFIVLFYSAIGYSQAKKWVDFSTGNNILALSEIDGTLWIGTNGGIVKMDLSSGDKTFYNRINSALPSNVVHSIGYVNGKIYFGSECAGLTCLSGETWEPILSDTYGGKEVYVSSIANEGNGKFWISYWDGGLSYFDGTKWTDYDTWDSQLPSQKVFDIYIDKNRVKWIGTAGGLVKIDNSGWTIYNPDNSGLPSYYIYKLIKDGNDNLWMATPDKGVIKYDGTSWTAFNKDNSGLTTNTIYTIKKSWTGGLWLGTKDGLFYLKGTTWTHYTPDNSKIPSSYVYALLEDSQHHLWVGTPSGLAMYDGTNWHNGYNTSNSPITSAIYTIVTLPEHAAYIGTDNGLFKYDGKSWTQYTTNNSKLPGNRIRSLNLTPDNKLLIGTNQGGAALFDGKNFVVYDTSLLSCYDITSIIKDDKNNLWFGLKSNGVVIFNGTTWETISASDSTFPNNDVHTLYSWGNYVWVGTHHGLARYNLTTQNWSLFDPTNSGLPGYGVVQMREDKNKNLWALVPSFWNGEEWDIGGLAKFVNGDWQAIDRNASGIESRSIYSFDFDSGNNIWIATSGGLVKFSGENNWTEYTTENSPIPTNNIGTLSVDPKGNVWFSTSSETSGIQQVNLCLFNENQIVLDVHNPNNEGISATGFRLRQNYPNPFNNTTTIEYSIQNPAFISLKVYDFLGKEITTLVSRRQVKGNYSVTFNASGLPPGIYFYKLKVGQASAVKRMILNR